MSSRFYYRERWGMSKTMPKKDTMTFASSCLLSQTTTQVYLSINMEVCGMYCLLFHPFYPHVCFTTLSISWGAGRPINIIAHAHACVTHTSVYVRVTHLPTQLQVLYACVCVTTVMTTNKYYSACSHICNTQVCM